MKVLTSLWLLALVSSQEKASTPDPKDALRKHWKPVTLALTDTPAQEVLKQVFEQSGETLRLPAPWNSKAISVNFQGVSFWQAVDEVCRLEGKLGFSTRRGSNELVAEAVEIPPTAYAGPLRFSVYDVIRVRELQYPNRTDRTEIFLRVQWTTGFDPILDPWPYPGTVEVVRAEDSKGRSLLPAVFVGENFIRSPGGTSERESSWLLRLQPIDRAERSISRLDVLWKIFLPEEVEDVVFDTPLQSEGVSRRVGDMTVMLESCKRDPRGGSSLETTIVLQVDGSNLPPDTRRSLETVPLARRMLQRVEVDGKGDRELFKIVGDAKDPFKATLRVWLHGEGEPLTLKFPVAKRMRLLSTPLSLTGIRVPESGK